MSSRGILTHFEYSQCSDQQDDVGNMRMLHGIHLIEVELESVLLELFERLVDPKGICVVGMGIDH